MAKKALALNGLREIKGRFSRFFSILAIVAIGVGFFAGVKATCPDMKQSADTYYKEDNLMHFKLISTYGFNDADIEALKAVDGVQIFPAYYADVILEEKDFDSTVRLYSYNPDQDVNNIILCDGRFPEAANECLVDGRNFKVKIPLGEKIQLKAPKDDDIADMLNTTEFTVVGSFMSPIYISDVERGNTNVGDGTIASAIYLPEEAFAFDYYTAVYVLADALEAENAYYDGYDDAENKLQEVLKQVSKDREQGRYEELKVEADAKIADAKGELATEKAKGEQKLLDAKQKLADAELELTDGKQKLDDGAAELLSAENELADGKKKLVSGKKELDESSVLLLENRKKLDDGKSLYEQNKKDFDSKIAAAKKQLDDNEIALNAGETQYNDGLVQYNAGLAQYTTGMQQAEQLQAQLPLIEQNYGSESLEYKTALAQYEEVTAQLLQSKAVLDATKQDLDKAIADIIAGKEMLQQGNAQLVVQETEGNAQLAAAAQELANGEAAYANGEEKYDKGVQNYNKALAAYESGVADYKQGQLDLEQAKLDYADGLKKYEDGKTEYAQGIIDFNQEVADAETKITDAESEIADLERPEWYIFTRDDNPGYMEYGQNAERINNISKIFPVFFLAVAALVCLTTMTRMVEEQRTQIGTLKALGYKNGQIIRKYLFYALTATVAGALLGLTVGFRLFPWVIIHSYGIMYNIPTVLTPFKYDLGIYCVIAAALCVALVVWYSCSACLKQAPAQLMRPKAPPAGKRVFLEKIPFIWKRLNFSQKVSARNIVRYKKRMFMTIFGIAGCTALILTGFGLRDSIGDIVDNQYYKIWNYQTIIAYDEKSDAEDFDFVIDTVTEYNQAAAVCKTMQKNYKAIGEDANYNTMVLVPESNEQLLDFVALHSRTNDVQYTLADGECIITEKLAQLLDKKIGSELVLDDDGAKITVKIGGIVENYVNHYVYMTANTYKDLIKKPVQFNTLLCRTGDISEIQEGELASQLLLNDNILQVTMLSQTEKTFADMVGVLDLVMLVLIFSAGALAFVVLYNLTNININERIREIATLKVLGFRDKEVSSYIFRENIILTLLGTFTGLGLGRLLAKFVIQTAEIDMVMFGRQVYLTSYLFSFLLTVVFSFIVFIVMKRYLAKVSMVESLKSIE